MTDEIKERIAAESKTRAKPTEMVDRLRDDHDEESPLFTTRDILNQKQAIRREALGFKTPIQALLHSLRDGDWWFRFLKDSNDHVIHLFFSKPSAHLFIKEFHVVFGMDCTYKTNRYKMPLLVITGVTNMGTTYYVGFCFLRAEEEDDYRWALEQLRELLLHVNVPDPVCIITDRERSCISQIKEVFPTSKHLLCIWHINKNVLANCKPHFVDNEAWEAFMARWTEVIYAHREADFNAKWSRMYDDFSPDIVVYLNNTWIMPYKRRFVKCFTDGVLHLGNITTSRNESANHRLKQGLSSSTGDLELVKGSLDQLFRRERLAWNDKVNAAKATVRISHRAAFLRDVLAAIPPWILQKALEQHTLIGDNMPKCTNTYTKHMGIPCSHRIKDRLATPPGVLKVDDFHPHWRYDKPASYCTRYGLIDDDEDNNSTNIDPLLLVQEPLVGKAKGRPRGSVAEPSAKRTRREEDFDRSTQRESSQFEQVEQRLQARLPPTPQPARGRGGRGGRGGQRGQTSRTTTPRGEAAGGAAPSLAITASQVARDEEDAQINAWEASMQEQSRANFITTWTRGSGLLRQPPRRPGARHHQGAA